MLLMILEAAFRSILLALAVWAGIRLCRVRAVTAQRLAWMLVLLASAAMPLAMRARWLAIANAVRIRVPVEARPSQPAPPALEPPSQWQSNPQAGGAASGVAASAVHASNRLARFGRLARHPSPASRPASRQPGEDTASPRGPKTVATGNFPAALSRNKSSFFSWRLAGLALAAVYVAGALMLLLRAFAGLAVATLLWNRSKPAAGLAEAAPSSRKSSPRIRISPDLSAPVTIGSTVVLPAACAGWDRDKLRIVLAHEQSHVRQHDFYLQILAALHAAAFWFSPLGWWLQRKLSELGEALSDRAGLAASPTPAAYAQILLEFAAQPRTSLASGLFAGPLTGVPMARASHLATRIERILNPRRFQPAAFASRRHAILVAALVPVALVAVVASFRIEPAVEAAQQTQAPAQVPAQIPAQPATTGQVSPSADQVTGIESPQTPASATNPGASSGDGATEAPAMLNVPAPPPPAIPAAPPIPASGLANPFGAAETGDNPFAIVHGDGAIGASFLPFPNQSFEDAKRKYHGPFVWFERNGHSYVIADPAFVAKCEAMLQQDPQLAARQKELERRQATLAKEMARLGPEFDKAKLPSPEFEAEMARVQKQIAAMHLDKLSFDFSPEQQAEFSKLDKQMAELTSQLANAQLDSPAFQAQIAKAQQQLAILESQESKQLGDKIAKELSENKQLTGDPIEGTTKQLTEAETEAQIRSAEKLAELAEKRVEAIQDKLGDLNGHFGDIQGQLGEIQGEIGERLGKIGEKQGELGERIGEIGEEMGKIGERQGKAAEEAVRKVQSLLDRAVKDGKAKPLQ